MLVASMFLYCFYTVILFFLGLCTHTILPLNVTCAVYLLRKKLFDVFMTASGHNEFTACKNIILNIWHLGTMEIFSRCCFHKYKQFFPIEGDFYHIT